jgi:hypothetical protein
MPPHPRSSVGVYTLTVRRKFSLEEENLGAFDGVDANLLKVFDDFCESAHSSHIKAEKGDAVWQVKERHQQTDGVTGIVEVGDSGFTARLMDRESGKPSYSRKITDAEMVPMFFLFDAPSNATRAIILIQRHGIRSPYSFFTDAFRSHFRAKFPDHLLEIQGFVSQHTLDFFREGTLQRITLISYQLSSDLADQAKFRAPVGVPISVEQVIKVPNNAGIRAPQWFLNAIGRGGADIANLPPDTDAASVTVFLNGQSRTLQLGRMEEMMPYIDATADVKIVGGHPTYESIRKFAAKLLKEVRVEIRGGT